MKKENTQASLPPFRSWDIKIVPSRATAAPPNRWTVDTMKKNLDVAWTGLGTLPWREKLVAESLATGEEFFFPFSFPVTGNTKPSFTDAIFC